jgi:hypothetical protein
MEVLEMNRQNTLVVSARVDARDLATLAKWWQKQMGGQPTSTSALVKESLGALVDMVVQQFPDMLVESQQEAFEIIEHSRLRANATRSIRAMSRGLALEQATPGQGFDKYDDEEAQLPDTHLGVDMVEARRILDEKLQANIIAKAQAMSVNGVIDTRGGYDPAETTTESLDVSDPAFADKFARREQDKLNKLKAGLGGDPRQA